MSVRLIERLTWAIVELTNPAHKPDLHEVTEVLELALGDALLRQEAEEKLQRAILRTAKVMGE